MNDSTVVRPRWFEDFAAGQVYDLGVVEIDEAEMVEFARRYDPQPFHINPDVSSPYGGLIASGWYTGALFMRRYVERLIGDADSRGSGGMTELRWLQPVRAGDRLRAVVEVVDTRPSSRHADRGTVTLRWLLLNQRGEPVLRAVVLGLFGRRPPTVRGA